MNTRIAIIPLALCLNGPAHGGELKLQLDDAVGRPVEYAAVWLRPAIGAVPTAPAELPHATIDQVDRNFKPLLTVVRKGTPVDFPNSDNIRHSVYSFSAPRTFTLKLYSGKPGQPVIFDKEGFVTLGCNIHDQMIAWVVVVDSPWFARSGATGTVALTGVPEGDYLVNAWHPGLTGAPLTQPVHIGAGSTAQTLRLDARPIQSLLPDSEGQVHGMQEH
jgi:plastocyanin